jgi:tetratricopeptide (TPR) repeat protein
LRTISKLIGLIIAAALGVTADCALAQQGSLQQQFDNATSLLDAHKPAEALAALEALESRTPRPTGKSLTFIRLRKGEALFDLNRLDESEASTRLGLEGLPAGDATLKGERFSALFRLGAIGELKLDYGAAVQNYREAEPQAPDVEQRINALTGAIRTNMFFDADQALKDADTALGLVDPAAKTAKEWRGRIRTLRARTLLNLGRFKEARSELVIATDELGGLTLKVDRFDLAARSDNAIAAHFAGEEEQAREYLAYTGAGRMDHDFAMGVAMVPPPCGGAEGLRPDDFAIVEFSIDEDGSVTWAAPIYSSRQGAAALVFAQAVAGWSWTPEQVKQIPLLFRALTRVELRCSTAIQRPWIADMFAKDVSNWLASKNVAAFEVPDEGVAKKAKLCRDELARRETQFGHDSPAVLPVLSALAANAMFPWLERLAYSRRALQIARAAKAPGEVIATYFLQERSIVPFSMIKAINDQGLLDDPNVQASPRASAALHLARAEFLYFKKRREETIQELELIRNAPVEKDDPLRAAALMRLASLRLATGDAQGAETAYRESGIGAEQCALLDMGPRLKHTSYSDNDYPSEVLRWGMEGWVKVENDILANGGTDNVRAVVAYPPLIFDKAATQIVGRSKFEVSFRPAGKLACGGESRSVHFALP